MRSTRLVLLAALLFLALGPAQAPPIRPAAPQAAEVTRSAARSTPSNRPVIAAAGDIACSSPVPQEDECRHRFTSDLLVDAGLARVLTLGDNQYPDGTLQEFRASFHPTWGRVKRLIRPSAGNHEYETPGAVGYFRYFGRAAGPRGLGYYSFDILGWHFVALNSNCGEVPCEAGSAQERWLRADLASSSATCTLAFWHHPRWSSGTVHGNHDEVAPFWNALYQAGADVVLVGHEHNYERFAPQDADGDLDLQRGVREFVVGTGGKNHYGFGALEENSEVGNADTFGVLFLTLHPTGYDWDFVPEAGGSFTDSGTGDCH